MILETPSVETWLKWIGVLISILGTIVTVIRTIMGIGILADK